MRVRWLACGLGVWISAGLLQVHAAEPLTPIPDPPQSTPAPARPRNDILPQTAAPTNQGVPVPTGVSLPFPTATEEFSGRLIVPDAGPFQARVPVDDFELQLALARRRISPGSLDGVYGPQTRAALQAFQTQQGLPCTGELDEATRQFLLLDGPPFARIVVRQEDLAGLRASEATWLGRSRTDYLGYVSVLEKVAELSQSSPRLIRRLNTLSDWSRVPAGSVLTVPNTSLPAPVEKAAFIRISLGARQLQVLGDRTNLMAHFPCSIGRFANQRPVGRLEVVAIAENPNYTFDPKVFPESVEARGIGRKLIVPPGPNNPVGVAWISLSQPGYGIHGTLEPEKVGRTESHGCFRLANWNAAQLLELVWISMPVFVEP